MMFRKGLAGVAAACLFVLPAGAAFAQSNEGVDRPEGEPAPVGYLTPGSVDYRLLAGPPPAPGSVLDALDMAISQRFQAEISDARWEMAMLDARMVYPRFDEAFGRPINRATSPLLVRLLNRVLRDASYPVSRGKEAFQRPRPYQRYQLVRRCSSRPPPAPEAEPRTGTSYPSGHTVKGWAAALVLAEVAPERAAQILDRGREYGLSRVICGYHFPTDVEAARAIATAVVTQLSTSPEFLADLEAARAEYAAGADASAAQSAGPQPMPAEAMED